MDTQRLKVLLINSHKPDNEVIKMVMLQHGFDVTLVSAQASAMKEALQHKYDIILMDINLNGIEESGFEIASQIKKNCAINKTTPMIGVMSSDEPGYNKKSKVVGMEGYINHPFEHADANYVYSLIVNKHLQDFKAM